LKAIDRIEIETLPQSSRRYPRFRFQQRRPSGRQVLELDGIGKSYGNNRVLADVSLTVMRGERVAIIGPNGIGKSTLLKIAMGEVPADHGTIEWGYETHPGYVAQDHKAQIGRSGQTVESWLANLCPGESIGFVRGNLAAVLFSGDEAEKRLEALSGGEAARLIFAQQAVEKPNVLVLDEPTNHLDLESIEALVRALKAFDGTLLFVSHDRWFVGELATRVIEITRSGINDFPGTYDEYIDRCGDDHLDAQAVLRRVRAAKGEAKTPRPEGKPARTANPDRARKQLEARLDQITEELQAAEARVEALNQQFCEATFFERTPADERAALEVEHRALTSRVRELMDAWENSESELEELRSA
jgi:ABC-type multidrug transport system ATPase subunit